MPGGNFTSGTSGRCGAAGPSARGAAGAAPPSGHAPASQGDDQSDLNYEEPIPRMSRLLLVFPFFSAALCTGTRWVGLVQEMPDSTRSATPRFVVAALRLRFIQQFLFQKSHITLEMFHLSVLIMNHRWYYDNVTMLSSGHLWYCSQKLPAPH